MSTERFIKRLGLTCGEATIKSIQRYKSEVISPIYDSEYVVNNPSLVYPVCIIDYELKTDFNKIFQSGTIYVEHGNFGCAKCDLKNDFGFSQRCDCAYNDIDNNDII